MKLMLRLELKHAESVKNFEEFEKLGQDAKKLFFDDLITELESNEK